jgi:hypothetical protein
MIRNLLSCSLALLLSDLAFSQVPASKAENGRLEKFVPLTTSRVTAFPDGPPPFQVQRLISK